MISLSNFSYIIDEKIAGSAHPGAGAQLAERLAQLRDLGFRAILTVCEYPLEDSMLREFEFEGLHLDVEDFSAPTMEQIERAVDFLKRYSEGESRVLVHCFGGYGRTGTILACYLVSEGMSAEDAIQEVRRLRPGSIEDPSQENAILEYERRVRKESQGGKG